MKACVKRGRKQWEKECDLGEERVGRAQDKERMVGEGYIRGPYTSIRIGGTISHEWTASHPRELQGGDPKKEVWPG